jgi:hypothetical protein
MRIKSVLSLKTNYREQEPNFALHYPIMLPCIHNRFSRERTFVKLTSFFYIFFVEKSWICQGSCAKENHPGAFKMVLVQQGNTTPSKHENCMTWTRFHVQKHICYLQDMRTDLTRKVLASNTQKSCQACDSAEHGW